MAVGAKIAKTADRKKVMDTSKRDVYKRQVWAWIKHVRTKKIGSAARLLRFIDIGVLSAFLLIANTSWTRRGDGIRRLAWKECAA